MSMRPAKTQISLGIHPVWSESSLSAWRNLGSLATHWAHSELWSDWADAQADESLRWAHTHFVGFDMSWLMRCSCVLVCSLMADYPNFALNCLLQIEQVNPENNNTDDDPWALALFCLFCHVVALIIQRLGWSFSRLRDEPSRPNIQC